MVVNQKDSDEEEKNTVMNQKAMIEKLSNPMAGLSAFERRKADL